MNSADIPQTFRIFLRLKLTHTQTYRNTVQYSSRRNEDEEVDRKGDNDKAFRRLRVYCLQLKLFLSDLYIQLRYRTAIGSTSASYKTTMYTTAHTCMHTVQKPVFDLESRTWGELKEGGRRRDN